jgi:hypothetical protein
MSVISPVMPTKFPQRGNHERSHWETHGKDSRHS